MCCLAVCISLNVAAQEPAPEAGTDGVEVLARGPVHEGFAGPTVGARETGVAVSKQPPAPVEELPPDEKPSEEAVWIPGYWAWDDDSNDFLWVSGIWRVTPPGYQWVSGYWAEADGGWQWVAGFWAPQQQQQAEYLPEPPATLEVGPNTPSPSAESFWVSGYWNWSGTNYAWRPGFWSVAQADWIWVPPYYSYTPSGYVFTGGYWDYPVVTRGYLYAPVAFNRSVWATPGFCYRPAYQINVNIVLNNLFSRPRYGHYYFGDYYDAGYASRGFVPWYDFNGGRRGYDPLFHYYNWSNSRTNPRWAANLRQDYDRRRQFVAERPPRTFAQQQNLVLKTGNQKNVTNVKFQPLVQAKATGDKSMIVRSPKDVERARALRDQAQVARTERAKLERLTPDVKRNLQEGRKTARTLSLPKNSTVVGAPSQIVHDGKGRPDFTNRKVDGNDAVRRMEKTTVKGRDGKPLNLDKNPQTTNPNLTTKPQLDARRDLTVKPNPTTSNGKPGRQSLEEMLRNTPNKGKLQTQTSTGTTQVRPTPGGTVNNPPNLNLNPKNASGNIPRQGQPLGGSVINKNLGGANQGQLRSLPNNAQGNQAMVQGKPSTGTQLYPPAGRTQPREWKGQGPAQGQIKQQLQQQKQMNQQQQLRNPPQPNKASNPPAGVGRQAEPPKGKPNKPKPEK
jgi:hypothetical protein